MPKESSGKACVVGLNPTRSAAIFFFFFYYEDGMTNEGHVEHCPRCNRELVWHEGAFAGWVHSNSMAANIRLVAECKKLDNETKADRVDRRTRESQERLN